MTFIIICLLIILLLKLSVDTALHRRDDAFLMNLALAGATAALLIYQLVRTV